ncbi:hypothetical protein [Undibacterium sp. WLHG33]|uniref:hypothetical protein n=1 Tax=Undibacterium sp. WLHG33 TaxID=3412482 RepID=UPI003C2C9178
MTISLRVTIKPSIWLRYLLGMMVILANTGWYIFLSNRELSFAYLLSALLGFAVMSSLSLIMVISKIPIVDLNISKTGEIKLGMMGLGDTSARVKLHRSCIIWQHVMALSFVFDSGRIYRILVLPDSLDPLAFHRLRVALIWIIRHQTKRSADNNSRVGNF